MGGTFDYGAYLSTFRWLYLNLTPTYLHYLGGAFSPLPWRYYYLYAAAIKTPVSLLVLFVLGTGVFFRQQRGWRQGVLIFGPILLFIGASCIDQQNIGLRRILPVYPLIILVASQSVHADLARTPKAILLALLALWQLVSVVRITPHHLSYFNELVGGPAYGIYYLDDSNIDWGQDLPSLRRWLDRHPGAAIRLDYFGLARPATYGVTAERMNENEEICSPRRAIYAVSAHLLVFFEKVARA